MRSLVRRVVSLLLCGWVGAAAAGDAPKLALILDDLGEQRVAGERALRLPASVALSYLPASPHTAAQAARGAANGHEILLHLPLQAENPRATDARALSVTATPARIARTLSVAMAQLPQAVGVNNHQGSRFTADFGAVDALMRALASLPGTPYFIDSRTTAATRAFARARALRIPAAERHVFIDAQRGEAAVRQGWQRWLAHARREGRALAIAHPYPETLALLEAELPRLRAQGYKLVPPSELLEGRGALSARATSSMHPEPR
jgi:hypothetical protein